MKDIIVTIKEIVDQMVTFLRYFAAPFVAAATVWMADNDHNVFTPAGQSVGVQDTWFWIIFVSLGFFGVSVYSLHRAVFIPFIERITKRLKGDENEPTADERSFARWERRAAKADSPAGMMQKVLDQANASGDFFYCTFWCVIALAALLFLFFPGQLQMTLIRWVALATISLGFALAGFIQHHHTVRLDMAAYRQKWTSGMGITNSDDTRESRSAEQRPAADSVPSPQRPNVRNKNREVQ